MTSQLDIRPQSADRSADRADRLFAAALAIVSARNVDEMLRETTVRAAEIIGAHQALTSLTVDRGWTQAITTTHLSDKYARFRGDAPKVGQAGIYAEVCRTNRPLRLTQAELEARADWRDGSGDAGSASQPPLRGFLAVPLVGREGRNLGLIRLSDRYEGEFEPRDEQVLAALAQFAAMAIEQLRLHADLAYQSRLTRTVAENATSGLFLMDPRGHVTYLNSAGSRIIGYDAADLADRPLHEVVHHSRPDGTALPMSECRIWGTVLRGGNVGPIEDAFIRSDGTFYPVRIAAAPILRDDRLVSVVLEVQDIGPERAVAGRLRDLALSASDRAGKLRGLIQAIGDAVVVTEPGGAVSLMNRAAVEMFGPRLRDVGELVARLRTEDGLAVGPRDAIDGSYLLEDADRETWVEARAFAVPAVPTPGRPDDGPDPAADHGTIYVLRDVTDDRRAKVLRETFIGMLSHELRTPITTLFGGAKILARRTDGLAPEIRSIVSDIEAESERLYRLVEDLVVLTKSEAADLEVGPEPVLLQRMIPRLVAVEARRWPSISFSVDAAMDLPAVLAEPTYIEQIVRNLLTNAAKYGGQAGTIEVVASAANDAAVVRVLDRGPGFPEADADRLFDIYYRSPQVARRAAGAGIGLFVCKSLVDAMDGQIWARERDGGGAEFGFALPALVEPGEDAPG